MQWGITGDIPVIGDNNGDGRSDYSIWRYSDVTWWTFGGPYNRVWGGVGDQPLSAGTPGSECRTIYNGRHNTVGLSENGDKRFACLNNRWYDCGWELNDPRWETKVGNGASELMQEVFGEAGRHARAAVGAPSLPLGVAVEVDAIVAVRD